jgi:hypothetical protein
MSDAATIKRHDGRSQSQTRRFVQKLTFCGRLDRRRLGSRSQLGSIAVERLPEHLRRELRRLCPFRRNDYWRFFGLFVGRMLGANGCQHRFGPARRDWGTPSSPPLPLSLQIGTPWPDGIRKASCAHGVGTTVEVLDFLLTGWGPPNDGQATLRTFFSNRNSHLPASCGLTAKALVRPMTQRRRLHHGS